MMRAIKKAYQSSQKKLSTPQINSVLENALIAHPPKIIKGIRPKLKYAHQGGLNPPQIIIHGNHLNEIKKDYLVFLESFFRKSFQLVGTPIKVLLKNSENPFDKKDLKPKILVDYHPMLARIETYQTKQQELLKLIDHK
mgnify:CR=1 FL=1